jgi:hypothetical protein
MGMGGFIMKSEFCLKILSVFVLVLSVVSPVYAGTGWSVVAPPDVSSQWTLYGVDFTSKDEGWAVGTDFDHGRGVLLHYAAGEWARVSPPDVSNDWELFGVHFTSAAEGWAVGRDNVDQKGIALRYHEGEWSEVLIIPSRPIASWYLNSVYFTAANDGWAVGEDNSASSFKQGLLFHYSGGTWREVSPPYVSGNWTLYDVQFTSSAEGWAVGRNSSQHRGVFLHFSIHNGWVPSPSPSPGQNWDLQNVYLISPDEGWAVGINYNVSLQSGVIWNYKNHAWTPFRPSHSNSWNLLDSHFVSIPGGVEGWSVGVENPTGSILAGVLMHYSGGSWVFVTPPPVSLQWRLAGVHFSSADEGWAVGGDDVNGRGVLLKYKASQDIMVTPDSYAFGSVSVGKTSKKTILIKNDGNRDLTLGTIEGPADPFSILSRTCTDNKVLAPGDTCSIVARFAPTEMGLFTSSLTVFSDDPETPSVEVGLLGMSGPADLVGSWTSLTQTCSPYGGGTQCKLAGAFLVQNIGYSANKSSSVKFYLSADRDFNPGEDVFVKKSSLSAIKVGASKNINLSFTFRGGGSATGKYVLAVVDPDDKVIELDDWNNLAVWAGLVP